MLVGQTQNEEVKELVSAGVDELSSLALLSGGLLAPYVRSLDEWRPWPCCHSLRGLGWGGLVSSVMVSTSYSCLRFIVRTSLSFASRRNCFSFSFWRASRLPPFRLEIAVASGGSSLSKRCVVVAILLVPTTSCLRRILLTSGLRDSDIDIFEHLRHTSAPN